MAGSSEEIGGISVAIQANTTQLDAAIQRANAAISGLGTGKVTITAEADITSARRAARTLKTEVAKLQRNESPIPVRFKFDSSRGAVRQTRESISKELARQGGVEVTFKPMAGAAAALKQSVEDFAIVVPVAFVWNGQWQGGVPTVDVNVRGGGGGGGGGQGGGAAPGGGAPVKPGTGPTQPSGGTAAKAGAKPGKPATGAPVQAKAAEAVAESAPASQPTTRMSDFRKCGQCGGRYYAPGNGWNRHQQSPEHKNALSSRVQGEAPPSRANVTEVAPDFRRNEEIMASAQSGRGIYTMGGAVSRARAAVREQRGLGVQVSLSKMVPGGESNPLIQRYVAAGGDLEALKRGEIKAVKGREQDFEEEFSGAGLTGWNRERTQGTDTRTGRTSAHDYARASPTQPGQFTEGAATQGGLSREDMKAIYEEATRMRAAAYRGSDEFKRMRGARKPKPVPGQPNTYQTEWDYEGAFGQRIMQLREMVNDLKDATLTDKERSVLEELTIREGFQIGAQQRSSLDKRYFEKALEKKPGEEPRIGRGARKFRRLVGGQGRKGPRSPSSVEDIAIIEVRDMVLDLLATREQRESKLRQQQSIDQAQDTRAINEAFEAATATTSSQTKATFAPGDVPTRPYTDAEVARITEKSGLKGKKLKAHLAAGLPQVSSGKAQPNSPKILKAFDEDIKLHQERIKTLEFEIGAIHDDDETIQEYLEAIEKIRTEELAPIQRERAEYIASLGHEEKKPEPYDPVTQRARTARTLEAATETIRDITYDPGEDLVAKRAAERRAAREARGPHIPGFAGRYNPQAPIGAAIPGETLSQRLARIAYESGQQGASIDRGLVGGATPVEEPFMPAWRRRAEAKDLTRYASGGGEESYKCECGRSFTTAGGLATHKRSHKVAAVGPVAGEPVKEAAAAEPIRTRGGTKAEDKNPSKFCSVCGKNVPSFSGGKPHEELPTHKNRRMRSEAPGLRDTSGKTLPEALEAGETSKTSRVSSRDPSANLRGTVDIEALEDIQENVRKQIDAFRDVSIRSKQFASQVVQENPVRALSVAVGQVLVNTIGGRSKLIKLQKDIDREAGELNQVAGLYGKALENQDLAKRRIFEIEEGADERFAGEAARLTALEPKFAKRTERRRVATEKQQEVVTDLEAKLQSQRFTTGLKTLAVGTAGIVAGTFLFQAAMAAATLVTEQLGIGVGRAVGRMTDFEQKTGELTASLGEAARANYGNVEGTVAGQLAMSGFGAATIDTIKPLLELRTQVAAGTKAFEDQIDLLRAASFIQQGVRTGPGGQPMDVAGVFETQGGFPLGPLRPGGQRSISELGGGEIEALTTERAIAMSRARPMIQTQTPFGFMEIGGPSPQESAQIAADLTENTEKMSNLVTAMNEDIEQGGLSDLRLTMTPLTRDLEAMDAAVKEAIKLYPDQADEIQKFADQLEGAGIGIEGGVTAQELPMFLQSLAAGATMPSAEQLARQQERPLRAQMQGRAALGEFQRGTVLPAQAYLSQLAQPLVPFEQTAAARTPGATEASNYQSAKVAIDAAQTSLRGYAAEGEKAANETIRQADALSGSNLSQQWTRATTAVAAYGKQIQSISLGMMWKQVNLQVAQYDEQLRVSNRSLADAREFLTGIDQAGNNNLGLLERQSLIYSRQSAEIGFQQQALGISSQLLGMQNQQLGIRSKELSLQSAFLGRQSQELGFQSQAMQLMQNQRQINFQTAMAGFAAPGTTPEERAARIEEAKLQADFAQKQQDIAMEQFGIAKEQFGIEGTQLAIQVQTLDLDKQQFALQQQQVALAQQAYGISVAAYQVQQQIVQVNAAQAVEDLEHQIALLTQARTVTIEVAIDQEALQALTAAQQAEIEQAQAVLEQAVDIRQQVISAQVQIAAALGQAVATYASAVLSALGLSFQQIDRYLLNNLEGYANLNPPRASTGGYNIGSEYQAQASGFLGNINGATKMVVGEAGTETVAILRNPREMMMGDGGGGGGGSPTYIQINVTGNTVRNDEDLDSLASLVAKKVEETMGRRASQLGFRVAR